MNSASVSMVMIDRLRVVSTSWWRIVGNCVVLAHRYKDWHVTNSLILVSLNWDRGPAPLVGAVLSLLHSCDDVFSNTLLMQCNDVSDLELGLNPALLDLVDNDLFAQAITLHRHDII